MPRPSEFVRDLFDDAGVRGWLHARPVTDQVSESDEVAVDPDTPVAMASLYKLPLLATWCRAVDSGELDPYQPMTHSPQDRTPGPTGISILQDTVTMSRRDTVRMMIAVSDNAAADTVLADLGLDRIRRTLLELGLQSTSVRGGAADYRRQVMADTGASDFDHALALLSDVDRSIPTAAYDSIVASSTTARDLTSLLTAIWTDNAAGPGSCAFIRETMGHQAWGHRLAAGFPYDDVSVAGKTGTLGSLRHEAGVVTFPDEVPIAVAVLTHAARPELALPRADMAIGAAARAAVTPLRRPTSR